jgi:hypothetical protein
LGSVKCNNAVSENTVIAHRIERKKERKEKMRRMKKLLLNDKHFEGAQPPKTI